MRRERIVLKCNSYIAAGRGKARKTSWVGAVVRKGKIKHTMLDLGHASVCRSACRLFLFVSCLFFDPEDGSSIRLRNAGRSQLHGVTTQNTTLFKVYKISLHYEPPW
jgi:hypothetical protein